MVFNRIECKECFKGMKQLDDNIIDLTVTSPPYDNIRLYNGYKFDFEHFKKIAQELYRITKKGGVVVWIVGDQTINGSESGTSFRQALHFKDECGFKLYDTMIFQKQGAKHPSSVRYYQVFEYMFILSKGKPKTFNPLKDRRNNWSTESWKTHKVRLQNGEFKTIKDWKKIKPVEPYGIRFNIWKYFTGFNCTTKDMKARSHPAIFPEALARDHILSWSNEGDLVFDPMCGSGTVCKMAKLQNRKYLGFEISQEYVDIAIKRVKAATSIHGLL